MKGIQFYCQGEIIFKELQLELILNARKCENRRNIELMTPFYADLKRICETTNWEAGSCMQNEKLIQSFKNKNNQLKDENKYEESNEKSTTILIQRLVFCDTNTTTWGNIWKIANSISIQYNIMKILRANFICNGKREFNVMIIAIEA